MPTDTYANFAVSTVYGGGGGIGSSISAVDTSFLLQPGDGNAFPSTFPFTVTFGGNTRTPEVVLVNSMTGDQITSMTRAQEGTSARAWAPGTLVQQTLTAGALNDAWGVLYNATGSEGATLPSSSGPFTLLNWISYLITYLKSAFGGAHWYTLPAMTIAAIISKITSAFAGVYNVRDYGAVGDGVTDDSVAMRACFDAARTAGGGRIRIPSGTYIVSMISNGASNGTTPGCLFVGSNCTVEGDGPGNTIIKLKASQTNQGYIIHNYTTTGGDVDITLHGFTIDGNAANQAGTIDAQYGCRFLKCRRVKIGNCAFKDIYGTTDGGTLGPNGTAGEGFAQQFDNCADCSVFNSTAYATSANTSTGFASNNSTNVQRVNCISYGWGHGMGFTDWTSQNIQHSNCRSYLNGSRGFNLELSLSAIYTNCISGGLATASGAYPFTNAQSLGNTGSGFSSSGSAQVQFVGCDSANNGQHGLQHYGTGAGRCLVIGGNYSSNTGSGIFMDSNSTRQVYLIGAPRMSGNGTVITTGGTPATATTTGLQSSPGALSTGVAFANPFPFPVNVRVSGGTVSAIAIDGSTTGDIAGWFRVEFGGTLTITFTGAPTVTWWSAL